MPWAGAVWDGWCAHCLHPPILYPLVPQAQKRFKVSIKTSDPPGQCILEGVHELTWNAAFSVYSTQLGVYHIFFNGQGGSASHIQLFSFPGTPPVIVFHGEWFCAIPFADHPRWRWRDFTGTNPIPGCSFTVYSVNGIVQVPP